MMGIWQDVHYSEQIPQEIRKNKPLKRPPPPPQLPTLYMFVMAGIWIIGRPSYKGWPKPYQQQHLNTTERDTDGSQEWAPCYGGYSQDILSIIILDAEASEGVLLILPQQNINKWWLSSLRAGSRIPPC